MPWRRPTSAAKPIDTVFRTSSFDSFRKNAGKSESIKQSTGMAKATAKKKTGGAAKRRAKFVYAFGKKTDGNGTMKALLGGKGANLAEMSRIGLPVPPGFTITTDVCITFTKNKNTFPKGLEEDVKKAIVEVEKQGGKKFGDPKNPL